MVSTVASADALHVQLCAGLGAEDSARVRRALDFVQPLYAGKTALTGQDALQFAQTAASVLAMLETDADTRIVGLLFELPALDPTAAERIEAEFGHEIAEFVAGVRQLIRLHAVAFGWQPGLRGKSVAPASGAQVETLRKMLLAMASDMRVVLVRMASRVTTLRYLTERKADNEDARRYARETFELYAPLANRLGVWQLKWELEDLSFRLLEPAAYKRIAKMLEERRIERQTFVQEAIQRLQRELAAAGVAAEVSGRPKHIYSIWNKMRGKELDFSELYDVRALRVIVGDVKACYTALGIVHHIWTPVPSEFDDYISRPKPNGYRSLHTVVTAEDGRALEVQVRTREMHNFAEYGVAAHWRYKESGGSNFAAQKYDEKIAWLRQLLSWKTDVADSVVGDDRREWVEQLKSAALDDRVYVLTPQARVIELPRGATPIDFAYHLHSEVGHRCRGARVDGVMVPLNTPLKNGQTVEIVTLRAGTGGIAEAAGPSRDWLSPGYAASSRTRAKVRAWFNAVEQRETLAQGRALLEKTLQREGKTAVNLEDLARKLGFPKSDDLFLALGKDLFSMRLVEQALHGDDAAARDTEPDEAAITRKSRASSVAQGAQSGVLVVGTEGLLTQLAKCCKPAPPDAIVGFVTRGNGVSIHRASCRNFAEMRRRAPERMIQTTWGQPAADTVYPVDLFVLANDRQGLLRDISDVLLREKINVIGVSTQSAKGQAKMAFTAEIGSTAQLQKALSVIREVAGVLEARRH